MLLQQAFVRKSFAEENPEWQDNEVLEFYGDSALNTYLTNVLFENFKGFEDDQFVSKKDQGELTRLRSRNSDKECLSHCPNPDHRVFKYSPVGGEHELVSFDSSG